MSQCQLLDAWADELRRIIRPGGFLIFSVLDTNHYLRNVSYREFHKRYQSVGGRDWNTDQGVLMLTYFSRDSLFNTWGKYFRVLELRPQYRDQSHLICQCKLETIWPFSMKAESANSVKTKARCAPDHAGATAQSNARRCQLQAIRRSAKGDSPLTEEQCKPVRSA